MPPAPPDADGSLAFVHPTGTLRLAGADLDVWAEHVTWCLRALGVRDGATIAVQDYGTSPLSFLGSSILLPDLRRGVAERLGGRFLCLDASADRLALTPSILGQIAVDALVVRSDVLGALQAICAAARVDADAPERTVVVAGDGPMGMPLREGWKYILCVEASLVLWPLCAACGAWHARAGFYAVHGGEARNLRAAGADPWALPDGARVATGACAIGADDTRVAPPVGWCGR